MDNSDLGATIAAIGVMSLLWGIVGFILGVIIPVYCFWKVYEKAGYNPRWSLFAFIPGAQLVLLIVIALLEW